MHVNQIYRPASCLCWLGLCALLASCVALQKPPLSGSDMEMFAPVAMRVHPLSRLARAAELTRLQARLELTDQMGDVGKGVGVADLALFDYQPVLPGHRGRRLGQWTVALSTAEANHAHWDGITRTYLLDVPLTTPAPISPAGKYVLSGTFTLPNGLKLKDEAVIAGK